MWPLEKAFLSVIKMMTSSAMFRRGWGASGVVVVKQLVEFLGGCEDVERGQRMERVYGNIFEKKN